MGWTQNISKEFSQAIEWPGKFMLNGGHAQQDIPSQHRLLNAGGMFISWWAIDQIRHIVFGIKMKSEGEYVEVKREDVPAPLRFLHKTIEWDPHSETPENQWKKLAYQLMPGVGAGVGSTFGSIYAFNRNGREQIFKALKGQKSLSLLEADYNAEFAQAMPLRLLAAFFGTFSAASGLTFLYGFFLNPAFATANGAKIFAGSVSAGSLAPHKAAPAELEMVGSYIEEAIRTGKVNDAWAKQFAERVLEPMFGHELRTAESHTKAVETLQNIVESSYQRFNSNGRPAKEIAAAVTKDLTEKLGKNGLDQTLTQYFGLNPENAKLGNANPILRRFHEFLSSVGLGTTFKAGPQAKTAGMGMGLPMVGASIAAGAAAALMPSKAEAHATKEPITGKAPTITNASAAMPSSASSSDTGYVASNRHPHPDGNGKTPEDYVKESVAMHTSQYGSGQPSDTLKWMGEGQLSVLPINRMSCAIGLTTGQIISGSMAKIATGYGIDGKALDSSKVPTYLKWMEGIVKDYNPKGLRPRDRWIKYAQCGVFALGGLLGVRLGTEYAYKNVPNKNKDPHYLEDYLPRISMHQGGAWSWLAASSAVFGSASGLWPLPIPGLNYGIGLAARATSMQDRNFMLPGLNQTLSGATTTSFLRLREGVNYLCHYAVNNPAENPAQLEYLAYTLLGPIFKEQLTVAHIQQFVDAVHEVRDHYWQDGGIPKQKRDDAMKTMREVFTGPGLEVLLIDMGLNPGTVIFEKLNGLAGAIGNVTAKNKIKAEQKAYQEALTEHLAVYVKEGMISQERAEWVIAGIEAVKQGKKQPALAPEAELCPNELQDDTPVEKFTERMGERKNSIRDLIKRSEQEGDWRDAAKLSKENLAPAVVSS